MNNNYNRGLNVYTKRWSSCIFHHTLAERTTSRPDSKTRKWYFRPGYDENYFFILICVKLHLKNLLDACSTSLRLLYRIYCTKKHIFWESVFNSVLYWGSSETSQKSFLWFWELKYSLFLYYGSIWYFPEIFFVFLGIKI